MAINSVLGPIDVSELGTTLIHEHLGIGWNGWEMDYKDFDRKKDGARVTKRLKEIRELGIKSIVDPCPMELGRDPVFAAEMSDASGVQVVVATGLYNDALGIPLHFRYMDVDGIAEVYVKEIEDGIGKTGIRAGIIKTACGGIHGVTPPGGGIKDVEIKCLRAAARASKATGTPILCHNDEFEPMGRETLDVFDEEKVDFNKVLIGHACGVGDMRYYFEMLDRGAWIGFDRFGIEAIASDKMRLASLMGLLAVGYDRIMLSHDSVECWRGRDTGILDSMIASSPNWNMAHISRNILPQMRKMGVSQATIDKLMIDNPRSYFDAPKGKAKAKPAAKAKGKR